MGWWRGDLKCGGVLGGVGGREPPYHVDRTVWGGAGAPPHITSGVYSWFLLSRKYAIPDCCELMK